MKLNARRGLEKQGTAHKMSLGNFGFVPRLSLFQRLMNVRWGRTNAIQMPTALILLPVTLAGAEADGLMLAPRQ